MDRKVENIEKEGKIEKKGDNERNVKAKMRNIRKTRRRKEEGRKKKGRKGRRKKGKRKDEGQVKARRQKFQLV